MLRTSIPFIDLRGKNLVDLLRAYPDVTRRLIGAARRSYGRTAHLASALVLPFADKKSHEWLKKNHNPYLHEIESFAEIVGSRGVYTLNLSYEWGCTSGAFRTSEQISLLRVLDWPFPQLGKQVMLVLQSSKAGDFYNITWPGMSGMFQGMAPGRFSAAVNLAPMRQYHRGLVGDWITNRMIASKETGMPPSHLLRQVFEQADSYDTAKEMLTKTPLVVPAIFILAGTKQGQGCIIERLEHVAEVQELSAGLQVTATNHFNSQFAALGHGWRPREIDSAGRYRQSCAVTGHDLGQPNFDWLQSPIINVRTRLCLVANAATGRLMLQGYEGSVQATSLFTLPGTATVEEETDFTYV